MRVPALIAAAVVAVVANLLLILRLTFLPWVEQSTANSVDAPAGQLAVAGLAAPVSVRRDAYGVPLIEAQSVEDLSFAAGYVMAQDRYNQMIGMTLSAQGRLAEMAGPVALPMDRYMRTLGVRRIAEAHYRQLTPELQTALARFSAGVNAWAGAHRDRLPLSLRLSGYVPEDWAPMNSMDIYMLLNLGLALNLHQEIDFLNIAAQVGADNAAWLLPTMPDEPLPFTEARKIAGADLAALRPQAAELAQLQDALQTQLLPTGIAASNNWVIAPQRTAAHASILANDTHLLLEHPPMWMLLQLRAPGYNATGVAVAGVPGIVAGYNGHIAWGMTMVMADGQDLFVERLRDNGGKEEYLAGATWLPVSEREETLRVRGSAAVEHLKVRATRHGPLVESALREARLNPIQPVPLASQSSSGLALSWTATEPDSSMAALWALARAENIAQAQVAVRDVR